MSRVFESEFHKPQPTAVSHSCIHVEELERDGIGICRVIDEADIDIMSSMVPSCLLLALNLFRVCVCDRYENTPNFFTRITHDRSVICRITM
jgi:hypothetical protein